MISSDQLKQIQLHVDVDVGVEVKLTRLRYTTFKSIRESLLYVGIGAIFIIVGMSGGGHSNIAIPGWLLILLALFFP